MKRVFLMLGCFLASAAGADLRLPTENDALYRGRPEDFYQYVERNFDGVKSFPWQGGQYGFVRNPKRVASGIIFTRLHEGLDIKPVNRNATGMPQDLVKAASKGTVVYVNDRPGTSNYGCYVVIQHDWDGCPYYTLYAHLNRVDVRAGTAVAAGQTIGLLGFTGDGIDRVRAHLHFEVNLLLSNRFDEWHRRFFPGETNFHGLYNGMNLSGISIGDYLEKAQRNPALSIAEFLRKEEVFYRIKIPAPGPSELARRYPWMAEGYVAGNPAEISFLRTGVPVKIVTTSANINEPTVSWVRPVPGPLNLYTKNLLQGSGSSAKLTRDGLRYLALFEAK